MLPSSGHRHYWVDGPVVRLSIEQFHIIITFQFIRYHFPWHGDADGNILILIVSIINSRSLAQSWPDPPMMC